MPKERTQKHVCFDNRVKLACTNGRPSSGSLNDGWHPSFRQRRRRGTTIPTDLSLVTAQVAGLGINSGAFIQLIRDHPKFAHTLPALHQESLIRGGMDGRSTGWAYRSLASELPSSYLRWGPMNLFCHMLF